MPIMFMKPESVPAKRPPRSMQAVHEPGMHMSLPKHETPIASIARTGVSNVVAMASITHAMPHPVAPSPRRTRATLPMRPRATA